MLKPMPKGVFIGIDELAGITAFLMSPAARNITGQTIVVDGGWTVAVDGAATVRSSTVAHRRDASRFDVQDLRREIFVIGADLPIPDT